MKKKMRTTVWSLGMIVLLTSCTVETRGEENLDDIFDKIDASIDEASKEYDKENEIDDSSSSAVELEEDKTYTVKEFVPLVLGKEASLKGQAVTIKGYYLNYTKQQARGSMEQQLAAKLYVDEDCGFKSDNVFFIMESTDETIFEGIKQYSELMIKGTLAGDTFFDAPKILDAKIVK